MTRGAITVFAGLCAAFVEPALGALTGAWLAFVVGVDLGTGAEIGAFLGLLASAARASRSPA